MKISIIGANGFIGQRLTKLLLAHEGVSELSLLDTHNFVPPISTTQKNVKKIIGDLSDKATRVELCNGADAVIHLAAILGGAAEANYNLARKINVDSTLDLFEELRDLNPSTRTVFASTVAVYSKPLPDVVDDDTQLGPSMLYGAQKLMMEVALSNFTQRGWLDGVSLRPSGVMARDGADSGLKTAFMSRLFYAVQRNEDIILPVSPDSKTWLTSVQTVAQNFMHAALMPKDELADNRAFTLPALSLTFKELVDALYRKFPTSTAIVSFEPDDEIVSLFGSYPDLITKTADDLGFMRDTDSDMLVTRAFTEENL